MSTLFSQEHCMRTVGMVRTIVGLLLFSLVGAAMAQEGNVRRYPLPNHGTIQLQAPASWKDELRQPPNALPPTIAYKPQSGAPFEVLLTPIWPASKNASPAGPDALRKMVQNAADQAKSEAVEKMIA